jgi:hypothetical protein
MTMSAAGTVLAFNVASPKFADLAPGYGYAIVFSNQTASDVVTGTFTVEGADASANDPCVPGTFAPLDVQPECSPPIGAAAPDAVITFDATHPVKAMSQCAYAVPCPKQFIRVAGTAGTLDILCVVTRLKRTGMAAAA